MKSECGMRQSDKEDLLYGNTGRKILLSLKKTQEIFFETIKPFLGSRKGSWELILTKKLTERSLAAKRLSRKY